VQINIYLLTYLLQGGRSILSLHVQDFEPVNRVRVMPPLDPKLLVWGTKPPEAGEYLSNKFEILLSPKISAVPSGALP